MAEKIHQQLNGVSRTLLITLYVRASETERPDAMIHDEQAVEMVRKIDCDFSHLRMRRHDEIAVIMRMKRFDRHVRDFLIRNPDSVVVHIGCGLDTRFARVDNGRVEWFDLDVPDVVALRQSLLETCHDRYHLLAASVFEDGWMQELDRFRPGPFLFLAEGVFPYFEEAQIRSLFLKLCDEFPGCEMVCDAHTAFVVWADNLQLAFSGVPARLHWRLKNPRDVESWGNDIQLLDEWNYYEEDEPRLRTFRWARHIPAIARSSGIYHYRFGNSANRD